MDYQDYYQTLGVEKSASDKEIKQAYRRLARENHPDMKPGDKRAEDRFKKINEALDRIEDGDYGYCEKCGEEVGVSRLEARPTAELCIDCKTLDEIREKQLG